MALQAREVSATVRRPAMWLLSTSFGARSPRRDTCVVLILLAVSSMACATTTARSIRNAPPAKNIERLHDDSSWIREEAALALGDGNVAEAVPSLESIAKDRTERDFVRTAAARALGRIGASSSFAVLAGVASERGAPPDLQLAVIEAVCRYQPRDQSAVQSLAPLASHEDIRVAAVAQKEINAGCVH